MTEYRSGDVTVRDDHEDYWRVFVGDTCHFGTKKAIFPDPQALADFIASQQPKPPRYFVHDTEMNGQWAVHYRADPWPTSSVAYSPSHGTAELICRLLNEHDEAS